MQLSQYPQWHLYCTRLPPRGPPGRSPPPLWRSFFAGRLQMSQFLEYIQQHFLFLCHPLRVGTVSGYKPAFCADATVLGNPCRHSDDVRMHVHGEAAASTNALSCGRRPVPLSGVRGSSLGITKRRNNSSLSVVIWEKTVRTQSKKRSESNVIMDFHNSGEKFRHE